jgi:hypothetical protein
LGHSEDRCWRKPKDGRKHDGTTNFVEVLLSDEEAMLQQLDRLCGSEKLFSYTRVPRRRVPVEVAPTISAPSPNVEEEGRRTNLESSVKSKILSHFIKGKIALSPMETVLMIPGELEHLENLVKLARRKKDAELVSDQVSSVSPVPAIRRICVNKTNRSRALHLQVEIDRYIIEGLVDTGASMSVIATVVVREMGMMHLVVGSESYKTTSGVITQALGRIDEIAVNVGGVDCAMTFMVVDTSSYDVLLGLDFLIKIGAVVDVEKGRIQIRRGPGTNVEVLPLTTVNLLQSVNSGPQGQNATEGTKGTSIESLGINLGGLSLSGSEDVSETVSDTDTEEDNVEAARTMEQLDVAFEFGDTELEELVEEEGLARILQLTLQDRTDEFMKEEISDSDDYVDWIQWVSDAEERRMQNLVEAAGVTEGSVLLQIQQMDVADCSGNVEERIVRNPKENTRWGEICQKIRVDPKLEKGMERQLWAVLEQYQDVFAWDKGELGSCTVGEHVIDTQGFPPCKVAPGRLSYWEEAEVNRQINVLVKLGLMRPSNSAYAC